MTMQRMGVIALGVLVLGALVYWFWPRGAESEIRRRLKDLVELVEKTGGESTFEAAGRARKLKDFFVDGTEVEYLPRRSFRAEAERVSGAFLQARSAAQSISIWVISHKVSVGAGGASAESTVKANAGVALQGGKTESRTLTHALTWGKSDGEWRIAGVEVAGDEGE